MFRFIFLIALVSLTASTARHEAPRKPLPLAEYHLAFGLKPGSNTTLFTCGEVTVYEGKILHTKHLTVQNWLLIASGQLKSKSNPDGVNLLDSFSVGNCSIQYDELAREYVYTCHPMANLWRLRYDNFPLQVEGPSDKAGWSNKKYIPSEGQLLILQGYGIERVNDFTYGANAFRLLHDISNPAWVATYRGS